MSSGLLGRAGRSGAALGRRVIPRASAAAGGAALLGLAASQLHEGAECKKLLTNAEEKLRNESANMAAADDRADRIAGAERRHVIAVVGITGSGKSSTANTMMKLRVPNADAHTALSLAHSGGAQLLASKDGAKYRADLMKKGSANMDERRLNKNFAVSSGLVSHTANVAFRDCTHPHYSWPPCLLEFFNILALFRGQTTFKTAVNQPFEMAVSLSCRFLPEGSVAYRGHPRAF